MQQVHEGATDFTRWTMTGHRRLLRDFDEVRSGAVGGPLSGLAWSLRYAAVALAGDSVGARRLAGVLARVATAWLDLADRFLQRSPAAIDAASGTYLLATRREVPLSDDEILRRHVGRNSTPAR